METRGRSGSRSSIPSTSSSRSKNRCESQNEPRKSKRYDSHEKSGAFRSRSQSLNKSTISSRSKSRNRNSCQSPNESPGDAKNQKTVKNTSVSRSRSRSLNRSTFSSRSKSKERCEDPNECTNASRSRSRSRSLNRSTISSRSKSRSRTRLDEAVCAHGRKKGTNGNDLQNMETKSCADRSKSRGGIGNSSGSMLLMPCMRGTNNGVKQATALSGNSNNDRCRSGSRDR